MNIHALPRPRAIAAALVEASRPLAPEAHVFQSGVGGHVLVADGSRIYDLTRAAHDELRMALATGTAHELLERLGLLRARPAVDDTPIRDPPLRALSLAIAQKCNLGCVYCYAREGDFGGRPQNMSAETARASVDLLLRQAKPGARINLSFLGGEPLANRAVLRDATVCGTRGAARR